MRVFEVEFTEDFGKTYKILTVSAKSLTDAYVTVDLELTKDGAITNILETVKTEN